MNTIPIFSGPLIIAVEGLCFSGKTTLAHALARHLRAGLVAEYAELTALPTFPPSHRIAVRTALSAFLAVEVARSRRARSMATTVVIYDRSPLSIIGHEYAMRARGIPADPDAAATWFSQAAASGAILAPDLYLHLDVPDEVFADRQRQRGTLPDHLIAPDVRTAISETYAAYFAVIGPQRVLELDGRTPKEDLLMQATGFITGLQDRATGEPPAWSVLTTVTAGSKRAA